MTVAETVTRIIVEQLGVAAAAVTPDATLVEDLGADSLDRVELVLALEEAFDIAIADADAATMTRVRDVVDYLEAHATTRARS